MDAMILLDLLGTRDVKISNSQGDTQWIWDRITRIEEKLGALKLFSPYLLNRIEQSDPIFRPGQPIISSLAMQDDHVPFLLLGVPICHVPILIDHTDSIPQSLAYKKRQCR